MPRYSYHTIAHQTLAPERYQWMASQAAAARIQLNFFPWVTVHDIPDVAHHYDESASRWRHGRAMKPTELACSLSHLQLWRQLLESSDDYYVIFEDDMDLAPNLDAIVQECLELKQGRLIKLSALNTQPYETVSMLASGHQFIKYRRPPTSAGGYIISRSGAESLVPCCENIHIVMDEMMRRTWDHGVTSYGIFPYPVTHSPRFESAVGDRRIRYDHNNPWMKGYSRFCRMTDSLRKRFVVSHD
ncbi:MAG TPA: glycosyltransferase family 25 protein [Planctomicrobium sp.]|nr:glycosyltransferase family 25 protein [Planctomicrobium sp.]